MLSIANWEAISLIRLKNFRHLKKWWLWQIYYRSNVMLLKNILSNLLIFPETMSWTLLTHIGDIHKKTVGFVRMICLLWTARIWSLNFPLCQKLSPHSGQTQSQSILVFAFRFKFLRLDSVQTHYKKLSHSIVIFVMLNLQSNFIWKVILLQFIKEKSLLNVIFGMFPIVVEIAW